MENAEASSFAINKNLPKPKTEGDYFAKHNVVNMEGPITRTRESYVKKKGYKGETEKIEYHELTDHIFDETGEYELRGIWVDLPETTTSKEKENHYPLVFIGSGASSAVSNTDVLAGIMESVGKIRDGLSFDINKIIILPHVASQAHTSDLDLSDEALRKNPSKLPLFMKRVLRKGITKDAAKQPTMAENAKILAQFLEKFNVLPDISPDGFIMGGVSLGGAQAMEMSALMGDKVKYLILMDPAGMSSNKKLIKELATSEISQAIKKHKGNPVKVARTLLTSWGIEGDKIPSLIDIFVRDWNQSRESERMANIYKFREVLADTATHNIQANTDSTKKAREKITANIVFAPVKGLLAYALLGDSYESIESFRKASTKNIRKKAVKALYKLFPQTQKIYYAETQNPSHTAFRTDREYMDGVFAGLAVLDKRSQ